MISEKMSCRLIPRGKKHPNKFLEKKISCTEKKIAHDVYNVEQNLTPLYLEERISNSREVWEKILKLNQ